MEREAFYEIHDPPERQEFLRAAMLSVAPELARRDEPDYFYNKVMLQRYAYLFMTLSTLSRGGRAAQRNSGRGFETAPLIVGTVDEYGLAWPVSVQFELGEGGQPEFIETVWSMQQYRNDSRQRLADRPPGGSLAEVDQLEIMDKPITCNRVALQNIVRPGKDVEKGLVIRQEMNFIARSLEAYERVLISLNALPPKRLRRPDRPDVIRRSVDRLFADL